MEIKSSSDIKNLTVNGLYYLNSKKTIQFISFKECEQNWDEYQIRLPQPDKEQILKYIGQRDSCSIPMFIEFFTKPFIRFEFSKETKKDFENLRDKIFLSGWKTIDLS